VDFDDLLAITLPANLAHLTSMTVITSPADEKTQELVRTTPKARLFVTDAFYQFGARFNKWAALELALDELGRDRWLAVMDADTMLPPVIDTRMFRPQFLYSPRRYMLTDPQRWHRDLDWSTLPVAGDVEFAGYCQIFHGGSAYLHQRRPWYGPHWGTASGGDSDMQALYPQHHKIRPPWHVLHIGQDAQNWSGRVTTRVDGTEPPNAEANRQAQAQLFANRRATHSYERVEGIPVGVWPVPGLVKLRGDQRP
jgi:hypothetical protein